MKRIIMLLITVLLSVTFYITACVPAQEQAEPNPVESGIQEEPKEEEPKEEHKENPNEEDPKKEPEEETIGKYTISFYVDGELYASRKNNGDEYVNLPPDPEKEGYVFTGWYNVPNHNHMELADENYHTKVCRNEVFYSGILRKEARYKDINVYAGFLEEKISDDGSGFTFKLNEDGQSYTVEKYEGDYTTVIIPAVYNGLPVKKLQNNLFSDCPELVKVIVPEGIEEMGLHTFEYSTHLMKVELPESLVFSASMAFSYCYNLKYVKMPKTLIHVNTYNSNSFTFNKCYNLTEIEIPQGIERITGAFNFCYSLKEVTIPENIITLDYVFRDCYSLEKLIILNIDRGCSLYEFLGSCSFPNLKELYVSGSEEEWFESDLYNFFKNYDIKVYFNYQP